MDDMIDRNQAEEADINHTDKKNRNGKRQHSTLLMMSKLPSKNSQDSFNRPAGETMGANKNLSTKDRKAQLIQLKPTEIVAAERLKK